MAIPSGVWAVFGSPGAFTAELARAEIPHELCEDLAGTGLERYDAVLVLADGGADPVRLDDAAAGALTAWLQAGGTAYVEYAVDGAGLLPAAVGPVRDVRFDRIFGAASLSLGLEPLSILDPRSAKMLPVGRPVDATELLTYGKVAGTHRALFGPPEESWPALLELPVGTGRLLYASTALSCWEHGRYRPALRWRALIQGVLGSLSGRLPRETIEVFTEPRVWVASGEPVRLVVRSSTPPESDLPLTAEEPGRYVSEPMILPDGDHSFEIGDTSAVLTVGPRAERYRRMVDRGIDWFHRAGLFFGAPDGSAGVAEGLSGELGPDGRPQIRPVHRGDGYVQVAYAFGQYAQLTGQPGHALIAGNLMAVVEDRMQLTDLNPLYGSFEPRGPRTDLTGTNNLFADDNGWMSLFALLTGRTLSGLRGIESLLRTANTALGLQPDPWRTPSTMLVQGWDELARTPIENGLDLSSHWQSSALSAYLVGYGTTGDPRYLDVACRGLDHQAAAFPRTRLETSRTCEAIRFILPLAGGYHYTGNPLYLETLRKIGRYLASKQDSNGGFVEWDGKCPASNEAYGVDEAAIFAANGDRVTDQLYASGFAALSLPIAHRVTGEAMFGDLATGILDYLSRIQINDGEPRLDGTWMRAFDLDAWEYYGSNADVGWGPYCVETGWSHAPTLIGAMLQLTGADFFPPVTSAPEPVATVRAEFAAIAAGQWTEPTLQRRADGAIIRTQGGVATVLGGLIAAGPPVWVDNPADGTVEVYARGADGHLHHSYLDRRLGQGRWQQVGELRIADDPSVVYNPGAMEVEVYALGTDGLIHHTSMIDVRGGHTPWEPVGDLRFTASPAVRYDEELRTVRLTARCTAGRERRTIKANRWHVPWQDHSTWITA
ncbi:hypothetical protein [Kribbella deserti]|uniref:hypothetical protein n=1 Tax=Kribbella deserti TaxID=1926257 RepID=UPI0036D20AFC